MRALLVADDPEVRALHAAALQRAGHEVCAASDAASVTARVRAARPELLVLAGAGAPLRRTLERARGSAEAPLPALLLLPATSAWLRTGLPGDLLPAAALEADARASELAR